MGKTAKRLYTTAIASFWITWFLNICPAAAAFWYVPCKADGLYDVSCIRARRPSFTKPLRAWYPSRGLKRVDLLSTLFVSPNPLFIKLRGVKIEVVAAVFKATPGRGTTLKVVAPAAAAVIRV